VRADKDTLIAESDVISVHLSLTPETTGIIGPREIQKMKPGVILINTARAPIVDQPAMYAALRSGHIAMAGLDVFDQEPLPRSHPLLSLSNVVMTPHIGYVAEDSLAGMYNATIETLLAYRQGKPINIYKPG
jgi:phosphoglycerate dehydrogenase-like enzyme